MLLYLNGYQLGRNWQNRPRCDKKGIMQMREKLLNNFKLQG